MSNLKKDNNADTYLFDFEEHVRQFNKNERKAYRSLKVKNIIEGIKNFGQEVASVFVPGYEEKTEERDLERTINAINKNAYARYVSRQGDAAIGTIKKEILPNGAQRTSVFTPNGSIERTEYVVNEIQFQEGIRSIVVYEGFSMLDVNYDGKNQLVYSYINLFEKAENPKVQVAGTIRETNGKFINFDYSALAREDMHHWKLGTEVERRLNGLEKSFKESYEEFSLNPDNIIDLTKPVEEVDEQPSSVEIADEQPCVAEEDKAFSANDTTAHKTFFGKFIDKFNAAIEGIALSEGDELDF